MRTFLVNLLIGQVFVFSLFSPEVGIRHVRARNRAVQALPLFNSALLRSHNSNYTPIEESISNQDDDVTTPTCGVCLEENVALFSVFACLPIEGQDLGHRFCSNCCKSMSMSTTLEVCCPVCRSNYSQERLFRAVEDVGASCWDRNNLTYFNNNMCKQTRLHELAKELDHIEAQLKIVLSQINVCTQQGYLNHKNYTALPDYVFSVKAMTKALIVNLEEMIKVRISYQKTNHLLESLQSMSLDFFRHIIKFNAQDMRLYVNTTEKIKYLNLLNSAIAYATDLVIEKNKLGVGHLYNFRRTLHKYLLFYLKEYMHVNSLGQARLYFQDWYKILLARHLNQAGSSR